MKIMRIHQGKSLPLPFRFLMAMVFGVLIIASIQQLAWPYSIAFAMVLSTLAPAVWFATNILIINMEEREIFNGVWVMGFKFGRITPVTSIEKVFVNRIKTKQTMYSLANSKSILTNYEYRSFLKLASGEKFFMVSHPRKERIIEKSQQVIHKLGLSEKILVLSD